MKTYSSKIIALKRAEKLLKDAREIQEWTNELREGFAKQFGCNEGLNRFPISGGVCEEWAEWMKKEVLDLVHESQNAISLSLELWKYGGCRRDTWLRLKASILNS